MRHFSLSAFFIGIGIGMIFSVFILVNNKPDFNPKKELLNIPDEMIIERALELGLIDPNSGINKGDIIEDFIGK